MPQSRNRRPHNKSESARRRERRRRYDEARSIRSGSVASANARAGADALATLRATADAELRGDPGAALRAYEQSPMFSDSLHRRRLRQLVELGDAAPGWLWSRWLTVQARRPLWSGSRCESPDPALLTTLEVAYPHGFDTAVMEDCSLEFFLATLNERDWLLRQLRVYEHGGLRQLVDHLASPDLLDRADGVREWPDAPMGGYRLDSDSDQTGHLQLTDLGDGRRLDVLDLGLAAEHEPGTCFLGRLVPIAESPGRMFEWQPLAVDEGTARVVAADSAAWLRTVAARASEEALPCMFSYVGDCSMVLDLPEQTWMGLLEPEEVGDLPVTDGLIENDDIALAVLDKLLRLAPHLSTDLGAARAVFESLLLEPGLDDAVRSRFAGPRFAYAWCALAEHLREPARGRCLRFAEMRLGA